MARIGLILLVATLLLGAHHGLSLIGQDHAEMSDAALPVAVAICLAIAVAVVVMRRREHPRTAALFADVMRPFDGRPPARAALQNCRAHPPPAAARAVFASWQQ